jgi:hypothetical protein
MDLNNLAAKYRFSVSYSPEGPLGVLHNCGWLVRVYGTIHGNSNSPQILISSLYILVDGHEWYCCQGRTIDEAKEAAAAMALRDLFKQGYVL